MTSLIRLLRTICHNNCLTSIVRMSNAPLSPHAGLASLIADHKHLHLDTRRGVKPCISILRDKRKTEPRTDLLVPC